MKNMIIPYGWKLCKQLEVATFYNGRAYKLSEWESVGTPVIRLQNLTGSGNEFYYSKLKLPERQYVNDGDLLYMWSATFGPKIWRGEKAIYHYHIWKVECQVDLLDQSFMYYNLDYITDSMKSKTNGSTMLHFTKKGMEEHEILVPPLEEQQKIAEILSTVDKKIDLIDQKIAETQKLKTGLMQKLFSEGVGVQDKAGNWQPHTEFQYLPLGKIPISWSSLSLRNLASIEDGDRGNEYPKQNDFSNSGYCLFLSAKNVTKNGFSFKTTQFISEKKSNKLRKGKVLENDIILTTRGTVGNFGLFKNQYCYKATRINSGMAIIRCNEDNFSSYLYCYMHTEIFKSQVNRVSFGSAQPQLTIKQIKDFEILLPPAEERKIIEELLSSVDKKIDLLKQQKSATQELKKGLMQKLLTGEWRVPIDTVENA